MAIYSMLQTYWQWVMIFYIILLVGMCFMFSADSYQSDICRFRAMTQSSTSGVRGGQFAGFIYTGLHSHTSDWIIRFIKFCGNGEIPQQQVNYAAWLEIPRPGPNLLCPLNSLLFDPVVYLSTFELLSVTACVGNHCFQTSGTGTGVISLASGQASNHKHLT